MEGKYLHCFFHIHQLIEKKDNCKKDCSLYFGDSTDNHYFCKEMQYS